MPKELPAEILPQLIADSTDAVLIMDAHCRVRYVNHALSRLVGYGAGELIGESINGLLPEAVAAVHDDYVRRYLESTRESTMLGRIRELQMRHRVGELIPIELKAVDLGVAHGEHFFGGFITDLRPRRAIEAQNAALLAQLEKQALTDALTGLPNRRAFYDEAVRILARAGREGWPVVVGLLDLDWFKHVNDQHGHSSGDVVLCAAAREAQRHVRAGDLLGRIGGEEFGLLLPHSELPEAKHIAERIRRHVEQLEIEVVPKHAIRITLSIGLALVDTDAPLDSAMAAADAALYRAKQSGRNRVELGAFPVSTP